MLSLCYLPTAGRLTCTIIKARNLKAMDITGTSGKGPLIIYALGGEHKVGGHSLFMIGVVSSDKGQLISCFHMLYS